MGRGGKNKKSKPSTEKGDVDVSQLSLSESDPSTSQASEVEPPVDLPAATAGSSITQPKPPEQEEEVSGLGLEGGKSKKRPRKKKKETGPEPEVKKPEPEVKKPEPQTKISEPEIKKPEPQTIISEPEIRKTAPVATPRITPATMPLTSGRGWSRAPVPSSLTSQQVPTPTLVSATPTLVSPTPTLVSPTPTFVSPTPIQPGPSFSQSQVGPGPGRGRGRGQSTTTSSTSEPVARPSGAVCRFRIPDKKIGDNVAAISRKIRLLTNYLEMRIQPIKVYRYDVSIKPERPKKLIPKAFNEAKMRHFPKQTIAFDQKKNCYSMAPLWNQQEDRKVVNVEVLDTSDSLMKFEVVMKFTGIVDLGTILAHMKNGGSSLSTPMEAIQCIDVILQQGALQGYVKAGRQYFIRPRNPIDLSSGLEMWTGLFQSAIFTSRAFINIDVAHKGFPKQQTLIDALTRDFRLDVTKPLNNQRGVDLFEQFLKGLRVKANIGGGEKKREYICNSLVDPPNRLTFTLNDSTGKGKQMTVDKYFEIEKKCRLRYPNLNCIWVGPRDKNIYYPMELLEVSYGQAINKQLNEEQLRTMVREAATPPNDRMNKIKEVIRNMNYSANPDLKHFKIDVANSFFQVNAKVLPVPRLDVGAGRPIEPRKGSWQSNRFLKASILDAWGLIAVEVDPRRCDCEKIIEMVKRQGTMLGMGVRDPKLTNFNIRVNEVHKTLLLAQERGIKMMIVVVSKRFKDLYDKVKRIAELEVGIITQCIKDVTVATRFSEQTVRNILLKINSKLMGVNQALEASCVPQCIRGGGVMVVGADVTHPSPDQSNIPSIAAVTASIDPQCFKYNIELSIQTPKHEIIVEFEDMMFDHLNVYKKHQNCLPRKIYVFRDGVSEGQFAQVMNSELVAVQRAYYRLEQRYKPEILFLLVQKRHHTRFFLGENNPQNVEPGTVVDTDIVHMRELDFYLVSHQAIKGTARPTRYHVVCNDGNIPSDEVEQLAYYLCHLYARCMRSVSYPAPTYYAHLACLRARALTGEKRYNNADLEKKPQRLRVLDKMLQHSRMFFV